jgi:hypothetical protein
MKSVPENPLLLREKRGVTVNFLVDCNLRDDEKYLLREILPLPVKERLLPKYFDTENNRVLEKRRDEEYLNVL